MVLTKNAAQNDLVFRWLFPLLAATAMALAAVSVSTPSRDFIRHHLFAPTRKVIAKADADLTGKGDWMTVIKVQTEQGLFLEIYRIDREHATSSLIKRIHLDDSRDGYFTFRGNATNLALTDVNSDGVLDIVAPTFDESLIPRLNVYKYDPDVQDFIKLNP
jgi:hypothetical protein